METIKIKNIEVSALEVANYIKRNICGRDTNESDQAGWIAAVMACKEQVVAEMTAYNMHGETVVAMIPVENIDAFNILDTVEQAFLNPAPVAAPTAVEFSPVQTLPTSDKVEAAMELIESENAYFDGRWSQGVEMLLEIFELTSDNYSAAMADGELYVGDETWSVTQVNRRGNDIELRFLRSV